ncbi:MAG: hypothetical protein AAGA09_08245 [Pseudomonadota bacterium]
MQRSRSGIVATIASRRPLLAAVMLASAWTALCVVGIRNAVVPPASHAVSLVSFLFTAGLVVGAPTVFAAIAPRAGGARIASLVVLSVLVLLAVVNHDKGWLSPTWFGLPDPRSLLVALALVFYFVALTPVFGGVFSLSAAAPFAAMIGVAGAGGFLAAQGVPLTAASGVGGAALVLGLACGAVVGVGVGADHAKFFAAGATTSRAAGASAHSAIAPAMFAIMMMTALFGVYTLNTNFGAVQWPIVTGAFVTGVASTTAALFLVAGAVAGARLTEETAATENLRRRWFARAWRPLRRALPASTAFAAAAAVGIVAVIAAFDGAGGPFGPLALFLALIWAAAAIVFVSLRTSLLIVVLLGLSALMANYLFDAIGAARPSLLASLAALSLTALALAQLTVSWRDMGERWRNARDIAENAMSDGLRRFLATLGYGAGALFVGAYSGVWAEGAAAAAYFACAATISLVLAPPFMTALSARLRY